MDVFLGRSSPAILLIYTDFLSQEKRRKIVDPLVCNIRYLDIQFDYTLDRDIKMTKLTKELIERGRAGELSLLGSAINEMMNRERLTFQQVVFEYNRIGLNYALAKSAYTEFRIDEDILQFQESRRAHS